MQHITPGTYIVFNGNTYTTQKLIVSADGVEVWGLPSAPSKPFYLGKHPLSHAAEVLACSLTKVYDFQPAALGKPRAHKLHKIMGRLGLGHAEHYRFAARALGQNVESLAALTVEQARKVWAALVSAYPQARALAA